MATELMPTLDGVNDSKDGLRFAEKISSVGSALRAVARALAARTGKRRQSTECFTRRDFQEDARVEFERFLHW